MSRRRPVDPAKTFRRLREVAREAERATRAIEEATSGVDVFGTYTLDEGEELDEDDLLNFVRLAREIYPEQELDIIVKARVGERRQGGSNGNGGPGVPHREARV